MSTRDELIALRLSTEELAALDRLRELHDKNRSEMIRWLIQVKWDEVRQYLQEELT